MFLLVGGGSLIEEAVDTCGVVFVDLLDVDLLSTSVAVDHGLSAAEVVVGAVEFVGIAEEDEACPDADNEAEELH